MNNLLVKYILREDNHVDPNFTNLPYGDSGNKGIQIQKTVKPGSYVFFHTSYNGKAYIMNYFYIERILNKGDNPAEIAALNTDSKVDEVIIFMNSLDHYMEDLQQQRKVLAIEKSKMSKQKSN